MLINFALVKILPNSFRALVIGSSGTIGSAFIELLQNNLSCSEVVGVHRHSQYPLDYQNPTSIESCAKSISGDESFQLIIKLDDVNAEQLMELMKINAIGPALTIRHFSKLLDSKHGIMVTLSAKVGSIEDNRLGGWYSYRASKAALNMFLKTASIELTRTKPNVALIAMHPGTVNSRLSKPFKGEQIGRPPLDAVSDMFNVIENLTIEDSGSFVSYSGEKLPW